MSVSKKHLLLSGSILGVALSAGAGQALADVPMSDTASDRLEALGYLGATESLPNNVKKKHPPKKKAPPKKKHPPKKKAPPKK